MRTLPVVVSIVVGCLTVVMLHNANAQASRPLPTELRVCEDESDYCNKPSARHPELMKFEGSEGVMTTPGISSDIVIVIEKFTSASVILQRTDRGGMTKGGSATYIGTIQGKRISGKQTVTWPGHPGFPKVYMWSALISDPKAMVPESMEDGSFPSSVPVNLISCEPTLACNGTWLFKGQEGTATWPIGKQPYRANLVVETWTPEKIVIRRKDITVPSGYATYTGVWKDNKIVGTADTHVYKPDMHEWHAFAPAISCKRKDGIEPNVEQLKEIGGLAARFGDTERSADCFKMAAQQGDMIAERAVGLAYVVGSWGTKNAPEGLAWLNKAALQDDYLSEICLSGMYAQGLGTAANPEKAKFWATKAAATSEGQFAAKQRAQNQTAQAAYELMMESGKKMLMDIVVQAITAPTTYHDEQVCYTMHNGYQSCHTEKVADPKF